MAYALQPFMATRLWMAQVERGDADGHDRLWRKNGIRGIYPILLSHPQEYSPRMGRSNDSHRQPYLLQFVVPNSAPLTVGCGCNPTLRGKHVVKVHHTLLIIIQGPIATDIHMRIRSGSFLLIYYAFIMV